MINVTNNVYNSHNNWCKKRNSKYDKPYQLVYILVLMSEFENTIICFINFTSKWGRKMCYNIYKWYIHCCISIRYRLDFVRKYSHSKLRVIIVSLVKKYINYFSIFILYYNYYTYSYNPPLR